MQEPALAWHDDSRLSGLMLGPSSACVDLSCTLHKQAQSTTIVSDQFLRAYSTVWDLRMAGAHGLHVPAVLLASCDTELRGSRRCRGPDAAQSQLLLSLLFSVSQTSMTAGFWCALCETMSDGVAKPQNDLPDSCCCSPCFLVVCTYGLSALLQPLQVGLKAAGCKRCIVGVHCCFLRTQHGTQLGPCQVQMPRRAAVCCSGLVSPNRKSQSPRFAVYHGHLLRHHIYLCMCSSRFCVIPSSW